MGHPDGTVLAETTAMLREARAPYRSTESFSLDYLHRSLAATHVLRLCPRVGSDDDDWNRRLEEELVARSMERQLVESERAAIASEVRTVPTTERGFIAWFDDVVQSSPAQHDPFFPWLAERASLPQMRWFLEQELAGDSGLEDLVALAQLRLPSRPKLELARSYWLELGKDHAQGTESSLLGILKHELRVEPKHVVWETLALGNLMVALATCRDYAYQAIGALGALELTLPARAAFIDAGLERLGAEATTRRYFSLSAAPDIRHNQAWRHEVFRPLVAADPRIGWLLAEGALMRLRAEARCYARYRRELSLS
jgi:hypothetical protein